MTEGSSAGGRRDQPQQIGRYRLLHRLGSGAMGVVYAAQDEVMGRQVALKVLIADLESDPDTRARFYREALAAARVIHPNVITIFDAGEKDGRSFIAMQLLEGAPLERHLEKPEAQALERKVDLMIQICEGLSAAHAQGVIHRDLKPSNLFVQTDGLVKIVDFGVARLIDSNMTAAGTMIGTPHYMSPEQARGQQVTASSDIFSAGSVFYFMLAGRRPFAGSDLKTVLRKIDTEMPAPLPPSVPEELAKLVFGAMEKSPNMRPPQIESLLAPLVRFRRHYGVETRRLAVTARSALAAIRDLGDELESAATALQVDLAGAHDATIEQIQGRYAFLRGETNAAETQPIERHVVEAALSELEAVRADLANQAESLRAERERVEQGQSALAAGNAVTALAHFESVLRARPNSAAVQALTDSTRPLAAEQQARDQRVAARVETAKRARAAGDWALAIRECQQALSLAPTDEAATSVLAEARQALAEEQRRLAATMRRLLDAASAAIDDRDFDAALASLQEADTLQRGSPEVIELRRRLTDERARAEAEAEARRLAADEIRHARAAFRRGRYDEAVQQLRGFIELEPHAPDVGAELDRLAGLRDSLVSSGGAARRRSTKQMEQAAEQAERGELEAAITLARDALQTDPTHSAAARLLDQLLTREFEVRVRIEEERLVRKREACAAPFFQAAQRAMERGYLDLAAKSATAAGIVAPHALEIAELEAEAAAQMAQEDVETFPLVAMPFDALPSKASPAAPPRPTPSPAESPALARGLGALRNVLRRVGS